MKTNKTTVNPRPLTEERQTELFYALINHITELVKGDDLMHTLHAIGFTDTEIEQLYIDI